MELKSGNELENNDTSLKFDVVGDSELYTQKEASAFPSKPEITDKKQTILKSTYSIVIFAVAFYFLFGWDVISLSFLIGIILIHELGHFIAMKRFDYKDLSIFFIPLVGAIASGEKDEVSQKQQIIISLAGPLPGLIIGSIRFYS